MVMFHSQWSVCVWSVYGLTMRSVLGSLLAASGTGFFSLLVKGGQPEVLILSLLFT